MTGLRDTLADTNYAAARQQAGPVNVQPVIDMINETLLPGVHGIARPNNNIANDSIEGALTRVRSMLTDGRSNLSDFNALFRAKLDLDDMIAQAEARGAGNRAHALGRVQRKLDDALATASPPYAGARDQFAADSRAIEAIDTGRTAARRGRAEDNIVAHQAMDEDMRYGFRGGYADPLIEQVQGAAPGVNKARPLLNDATMAEIPEFAVPGQADKLLRRIGREDEMFQTRARATGGSLTADNLMDAAGATKFDPTIAQGMLSGRPIAAALDYAMRALKGENLPPSVLSKVARALMETDPQAARELLERSAGTTAAGRSRAIAIMNALGATEPARNQRSAILEALPR